LLIIVPCLEIKTQKVSAVTGNDFQSGRIIDDGVFFNGNALTQQQIQEFMNAKVPVCDTWGSQPRGNVSRASHGTANGYPPPYICLKEYSMAIPDKVPEAGLCNGISNGTKSSAQIIFEIQQSCSVSAKVILVLLQKEQSLVTDDWPWPIQYRSATGYGCPDTAPCDAEYYGFFNQVYNAARQYKRYVRDAQQFNYRRDRNNYIQYNPNAGCGGSSIYIQNGSTAGLYNYTPYQPNQAALNNLYGTGDGCSAYGNRNFWRLYNDWFGNTFGLPFAASFRGSSPRAVVKEGMDSTLYFDFQNNGSQFWKDDASALPYYPRTRLMGTWPVNRVSPFYKSTWPSPSRPVSVFTKVFESDGVTLTADQHTVWPGQVGRFQFNVQYPSNGIAAGYYQENFDLVQDGTPDWWVPGGYAWQTVLVPEPFAAGIRAVSPEATVRPSVTDTLSFDFQNTGARFWKDDASALPYYPRTRLMGTWPINRTSAFAHSSWLGPNRPVNVFNKVFEADGVTLAADQHTVWPGQVGRFLFTAQHPTNGTPVGKYKENFDLVQDGAPNWWVLGGYAWQAINVAP
jgi:hypothetical protein